MTAPELPAVSRAAHRRWRRHIRQVLDRPKAVTVVLQPIVDLARGAVVGHEALARFEGSFRAGPDVWFAAADAVGLGAQLSARVLDTALPLVDDLPPNTFLTVNLEPEHLLAPAVVERLTGHDSLQRIFVELTEHTSIGDPAPVVRVLDELRARGARVAVDDTGAGYAGLQALLVLRPDLVKLDRSLVTDVDRDPARRALLRMVGYFASDIDAWVLAEGIERGAELDELVRLGVPLGQGYLLGRPEPQATHELAAELVERLHQRLSAQQFDDRVAPLVETVARVASGGDTVSEVTVVVDTHRRPRAVMAPGRDVVHTLLKVKPSDRLDDIARRMITRSDGRWSDPAVVCDDRGRCIGIVPVQRLLERLATRSRDDDLEPSARASSPE